jgi:hypothetical protein
MAKNLAQGAPTTKSPERGGKPSLMSVLAKKMVIPGLFDNNTVPTKYMGKVVFLVFLLMLYVANGHWANKMLVKTNKMQQELEDAKVDYQTTKADYMQRSIQSQVAKSVETMELQESKTPPKKIKFRKEEL